MAYLEARCTHLDPDERDAIWERLDELERCNDTGALAVRLAEIEHYHDLIARRSRTRRGTDAEDVATRLLDLEAETAELRSQLQTVARATARTWTKVRAA